MNDITPRPPAGNEAPQAYYLAAVTAYYQREGQLKERQLNVLLETDLTPALTKDSLAQIHHAAIRRLGVENNVPVSEIQDIVILNIFMLGVMLPSEFQGTDGQLEG